MESKLVRDWTPLEVVVMSQGIEGQDLYSPFGKRTLLGAGPASKTVRRQWRWGSRPPFSVWKLNSRRRGTRLLSGGLLRQWGSSPLPSVVVWRVNLAGAGTSVLTSGRREETLRAVRVRCSPLAPSVGRVIVDGVIGNISVSETEDSWFEPRSTSL